jgi:AcrR family transcriptional regulator
MSSMTSTTTATRPPRRTAEQTRAHLLAVAQRLFYWEGIHATGVDRVASEAQVAPTVLYRAFGSKDGLVAAYVAANAAGYRTYLQDATTAEYGNARERILRLFDAVLLQAQPDVCRGCPFLMTLSEFPDQSNEAHRIAVATKQWVRDHLHGLVHELAHERRDDDDHRTPTGSATEVEAVDELTDQLALVLEGIYASVQALTATGPAARARSAAAVLVDAFEARTAS